MDTYLQTMHRHEASWAGIVAMLMPLGSSRELISPSSVLTRPRALCAPYTQDQASESQIVIPAKAGIHCAVENKIAAWIPAFAGMTQRTHLLEKKCRLG